MTTPDTRRRRRAGRGRGWVQDAVRAAVSTAHTAGTTAKAPAAEQALWWHHTATALDLIGEHEADTARAQTAKTDADVARRLSRGLALTHADAMTTASAQEPTAEASDDVDELEVSGL